MLGLPNFILITQSFPSWKVSIGLAHRWIFFFSFFFPVPRLIICKRFQYGANGTTQSRPIDLPPICQCKLQQGLRSDFVSWALLQMSWKGEMGHEHVVLCSSIDGGPSTWSHQCPTLGPSVPTRPAQISIRLLLFYETQTGRTLHQCWPNLPPCACDKWASGTQTMWESSAQIWEK